MNPRDLIDFAQDDNGVEFRKALYGNIHDKVMSAIESRKQQIASNLISPQYESSEEEYDLDEESEQIDEISADLAGKYLTAPQGKGANKYKVSMDKSVYPNYDAMSKHDKSVGRALKRSGGSALNKKPSYYKEEEVEELDELKKSTVSSYVQKKFAKMNDNPSSSTIKTDAKGIQRAGSRMSGMKATQKEEVDTSDE